jgi:hypothetical protein
MDLSVVAINVGDSQPQSQRWGIWVDCLANTAKATEKEELSGGKYAVLPLRSVWDNDLVIAEQGEVLNRRGDSNEIADGRTVTPRVYHLRILHILNEAILPRLTDGGLQAGRVRARGENSGLLEHGGEDGIAAYVRPRARSGVSDLNHGSNLHRCPGRQAKR